jgi:plasmid stabilization system protein ParE
VSHEVLFEPAASRELNEAADFYDLEQPGLGSEFLDAVEAALLTVVDNPRAFPILLGETRRRVVSRFPYSLLYWFDGTTVHVSAVAHHKQRPGYWGERG